MLGIVTKLIHILTLSPFSIQSGLWKVPELDFDNNGGNEELPSSKDENGISVRRSIALDHLKTITDALVRRGLEKTTIGQPPGIYRASPWEDILESLIGLLITRMTLSYSENQTIIFLVGFSHVGFIISTILLLVELAVGQERTAEYLEVMDLVYRFTNISTALFLLAVIAKIYYSIFPPVPVAPIILPPGPVPYPVAPIPVPVPLPMEKSLYLHPYNLSPVQNGQNMKNHIKNFNGF